MMTWMYEIEGEGDDGRETGVISRDMICTLAKR